MWARKNVQSNTLNRGIEHRVYVPVAKFKLTILIRRIEMVHSQRGAGNKSQMQ